jgi:DNA-binding response OmpR family regulator
LNLQLSKDTSSLGDQLTVIRFEAFEMDINSRRLLDGGKPVRIGARAFDLLRYLALNAGRILSKAELLEAVWPKATVDEIAIRVHRSSFAKFSVRSLTTPGSGRSRARLPLSQAC